MGGGGVVLMLKSGMTQEMWEVGGGGGTSDCNLPLPYSDLFEPLIKGRRQDPGTRPLPPCRDPTDLTSSRPSPSSSPCSSLDCQAPRRQTPTQLVPNRQTSWQSAAAGLQDPTRPVEVKGVCVECISSCDCAIGMYCSHDYILPKFTPTNLDFKLTKIVNLHSQAYAGLAIRSICRSPDLTITSGTCSPVDYISLDPFSYTPSGSNVRISSQGLNVGDKEKYCGSIRAFATSQYPYCVGNNCPPGGQDKSVTNRYFNSAAVCQKVTYEMISSCLFSSMQLGQTIRDSAFNSTGEACQTDVLGNYSYGQVAMLLTSRVRSDSDPFYHSQFQLRELCH
eukprot:755345-Hanusia_phi.AAC.2